MYKRQINDPARDPDVHPVLWEIRRERRIELIMDCLLYTSVADGCRREEGPLVGMGETGRAVVTSVQFQ